MGRWIEHESRPEIIAHLPRYSPFFEESFELGPISQSGEEGTDDHDTASIDPFDERR